jgi:protein-L-isoaspartate(D-aspartate) O-methyltransferase
VHSVEIFPELTVFARANVASLVIANTPVSNVQILTADAMQLDSAARYNAIAVTGSVPMADDRFKRQLEIGGRLFIVVGEPPVMVAWLIRRTAEDAWTSQSLFETVIDPLVNARRPQEFTF